MPGVKGKGVKCFCYACELHRWVARRRTCTRRGREFTEPRPTKSAAEKRVGVCPCSRCRAGRQRQTAKKNRVLVGIVGDLLAVIERAGLTVECRLWQRMKSHGVRRRAGFSVSASRVSGRSQ